MSKRTSKLDWPQAGPTPSYHYIKAWNKLLGSQPDYTAEQVKLARREGAPANALYRNSAGHWRTTDSILHPTLRSALQLDEGE